MAPVCGFSTRSEHVRRSGLRLWMTLCDSQVLWFAAGAVRLA